MAHEEGASEKRTVLVGAAISASHKNGSYLKDKYHRLKARRGALPAALAIVAYHMHARRVGYHARGEAYLGQLHQTRTVATRTRRLERILYHVPLQPNSVAA